MKELFRVVARCVSGCTARFPRLQRFLRRSFLALPVAVRGEQMIHDHFRRIARREGELFFLQIGANDGTCNDPLSRFVKKYHWRGVVVEPIKEYFDQLCATYRGEDVVCENVAVSDRVETREFFYLTDEDGKLPGWAKGVGSFFKENVLAHAGDIGDLEDRLRTTELECVPVSVLLERNAIERCDVLVIDTEGYDAQILKQIDFTALRPGTVIFEHMLLSREELESCMELLKGHEYRVRKDRYDVLAVRE